MTPSSFTVGTIALLEAALGRSTQRRPGEAGPLDLRADASPLARLVERSEWLTACPDAYHAARISDPEPIRRLVESCMAASPAGGWLTAPEAFRLVELAGIDVVAPRHADTADAACDAAAAIGYPVVLKVAAPEMTHKSDQGGLKLELDSEALRQLRSLRVAPLLDGFRGSLAVDAELIADVLVRLGELAELVPELVTLDINPLIATPRGVCAVDVKVRLRETSPGSDPLRPGAAR